MWPSQVVCEWLSVSLSCSHIYPRTQMSNLHRIFYARCLQLRISPTLGELWHIMYFWCHAASCLHTMARNRWCKKGIYQYLKWFSRVGQHWFDTTLYLQTDSPGTAPDCGSLMSTTASFHCWWHSAQTHNPQWPDKNTIININDTTTCKSQVAKHN